MPGRRLDEQAIEAPRFAVLGFADEFLNCYMTHVAVLEQAKPIKMGSSVVVIHIKPPLDVEPWSENTHCCWLKLSVEEELAIQTWLVERREEMAPRRPADQFCIFPHFREDRDPVSKRVRRHRYSCVGFALEALRAGTQLEIVDVTSLPTSELDDIELVFPDITNVLDQPKTRRALGIPDNGAYPVLLPGHLFHSLHRPDSEIRTSAYRPIASDKYCT